MMKKLPLLFLSALLLLSLLTACQRIDTAKQERESDDLIQGMQKDGNLQVGAQVERSTDKDGNTQVTYTNPDGSGGGGVAYD